MSDDRWDRVEDLFHRAAELPPADRTSFLEELCGDDQDLRAEVEALLGADGGPAGGFLAPPDKARVDDAVGRGEAPSGRRIGAWRLDALLGEGGMGRVWRATRVDGGFRQIGALKLLRAGFDTAEVLARFENERQTLARLEHPSIARLIDGGATDDGLPFLVMEHVEGSPIDAHCDGERLSIDGRIRLFLGVLDAVAFAHRNLVVHRDLKPANVLVDRAGRPRLLDFGIAKFLDPADDALKTLLTAPGAQPMTPAFASPEQLRGRTVTTATDVYALGVLLYRLLTGRLPYDLQGLSPAELERTVCETDPRKPSTAVRDGGDAAPLPAPRSVVGRRLAGDLDNIVLKAMHKEPDRRYRSASAFADDLRRYLDGRPVEARGDDAAYRVGKLLRRHRFAVALASIALVGASALATLWVGAALRDRDRLRDIARLSGERGLRDLTRDWEALSPARPDHRRGFEEWIARAEVLLREMPEHERTLAALRARGEPLDGPLDDETEDLRAYADGWRARRDALDAAQRVQVDAALARADRRLDELRRRADRYRPHAFADREDQWWHDQLTELVEALDGLAADDPHGVTLRAARDGLQLATDVRRRSIEAHREEWDAALARLADAGVRMAPQVGLVPLGTDPDSGREEFWHLATGERPARGDDGRLRITEESGLVLVLVPGGTYTIGAQRDDPDAPHHDAAALPVEWPVHDVTLDPFFLSKYEMTQAQWLRVTGDEPSGYQPSTHDVTLLHPVEQVSFDDARQVLFRLGLVLPTEARWEAAARAGTDTPWWTGATPAGLDAAANLADLHARDRGAPGGWSYAAAERYDLDDGAVLHAPVDRFRPNPFGLHQTIGNVWEWCADDGADYAAVPPAPGDGAREVRGASSRASRGGGFFNPPALARVSHRHPLAPGFFSHSLGVRPARDVEPPTEQ